MTDIIICLPKHRIAESNRLRWRHNKHKKPFYFLSEINQAVRRDKEVKYFFKNEYKGVYRFEKR